MELLEQVTIDCPRVIPVEAVEGLAFDPGIGRIASQPGSQANAIWMPVRLSGLAPESIVLDNRAYLRIIGRDGTTLYSGLAIGEPQDPAALV